MGKVGIGEREKGGWRGLRSQGHAMAHEETRFSACWLLESMGATAAGIGHRQPGDEIDRRLGTVSDAGDADGFREGDAKDASGKMGKGQLARIRDERVHEEGEFKVVADAVILVVPAPVMMQRVA